jgi:hypothetical protein
LGVVRLWKNPGFRPVNASRAAAKYRFSTKNCDNAATVRSFIFGKTRFRPKRQQLPLILACRYVWPGV